MDGVDDWFLGAVGLFIILTIVGVCLWASNDCMKKSCPPGMEPNFNQQAECLCVTRPK